MPPVPEHAVREQLFRLLPPPLAADARRVVGSLGELERQLWQLARLMHEKLDHDEFPTLSLLQDWVDVSRGLDRERGLLLARAEALLDESARTGLGVEFVELLRERLQPFVDDVAEAQRYFRSAAERVVSHAVSGSTDDSTRDTRPS